MFDTATVLFQAGLTTAGQVSVACSLKDLMIGGSPHYLPIVTTDTKQCSREQGPGRPWRAFQSTSSQTKSHANVREEARHKVVCKPMYSKDVLGGWQQDAFGHGNKNSSQWEKQVVWQPSHKRVLGLFPASQPSFPSECQDQKNYSNLVFPQTSPKDQANIDEKSQAASLFTQSSKGSLEHSQESIKPYSLESITFFYIIYIYGTKFQISINILSLLNFITIYLQQCSSPEGNKFCRDSSRTVQEMEIKPNV